MQPLVILAQFLRATVRGFAALRLIDILIRANMPSPVHRVAIIIMILLTLSLLCACGRPPADSSNSDSQKLPFDRAPRSTGISPSQSLLPSVTKLPEGTLLPIRLLSGLSSASSHAGDTFYAVLDEPVVIDGQTLVARGTSATGRVLEAKPAASSLDPGYLRVVLVSLKVGGRTVKIETSSIFVKGGSREERKPATGVASGASPLDIDRDKSGDIRLDNDRRLNFHLAQAADLQQ